MKMIHLSDLHIGKKVHEYSMLEEQKAILQQILSVIDSECPDAVLIAGDVYDKAIPSAEAVELFDEFLVQLAHRKQQVLIISGNHDSAERLAFGRRLFSSEGIHIAPVYRGEIAPVTLKDAYGEVNFYLLPFIKPSYVRNAFPEEEVGSYTDAVAAAVRHMNIDISARNVLLSHQFVTGSERCESEEISVGGSDNVDSAVYAGFDYVALGHLHSPQNVGSEKIRYCGTPLKYSFSEARHTKSVTVAELKNKGELSIRTIPLTPLHDMKEIRGTFAELTEKSYYEDTTLPEDYLRIILTDEEELYEARARLNQYYHRLLLLEYDNTRTRHKAVILADQDADKKTPFEVFCNFYEMMNNQTMSVEQQDYIRQLLEELEEEQK